MPIAALRRLGAKRLLVLTHDLMERPLLGMTRSIAERRRHVVEGEQGPCRPHLQARRRVIAISAYSRGLPCGSDAIPVVIRKPVQANEPHRERACD